MRIQNINFNPLVKGINNKFVSSPQSNLPQLKEDTVSFTAKKNSAEIKAKEELKIKKKLSKLDVDFNNLTNEDAIKVFDFFDITASETEDSKLIISHYDQPEGHKFSDLGVNENELLKNVEKIDADADFSFSRVSELPNLKAINGNAFFAFAHVTNLDSLEVINGDLDLGFSNIVSMKNLNHIGKSFALGVSKIRKFESLEYIGESAYCNETKNIELPKLKTIGNNAYFKYSKNIDLSSLQDIGNTAIFHHAKNVDLSNLNYVKEGASFPNTEGIKYPSSFCVEGGNPNAYGSKDIDAFKYIGLNYYSPVYKNNGEQTEPKFVKRPL